MPRYLVEHDFGSDMDVQAMKDWVGSPSTAVGDDVVTWVDSYISVDYTRTYCIYNAPTPDAIRRYAAMNNLPVNRITEIRRPEPFFCR